MYTEYFSLKEKPFNLTPSPRFLYLSESHKEALALLTYGVMERKGFVLLTGEVGTGKTTILQTLLGTLDKRVECVHLSNPLLSSAEFIDYLSHSVFKTVTGKQSKTEFLLKFEEYLRKSAQQQSNFLLVIDEAQKLSFDLLEEIRLLSNMETADEKLINIFLVGQPELNQKLGEVRCRPLLQRISIRHHISPLSLKETGEYIVTRLKVAGAKDTKWIFPAGAIRTIHRLSKGYPRMINILADNALLSAYSSGTKRVTSRMVEQSFADLHLGASPATGPQAGPSWTGSGTEGKRQAASGRRWKWGTAFSTGIAATALAILIGNGIWTSRTHLPPSTQEAPPPVASGPMIMQPISPPPVESRPMAVQPFSPPAAASRPMAVQPSSPPPSEKVEEILDPFRAKALPPMEPEEVRAGSSTEPAKSELLPVTEMEEIKKEEVPPPDKVIEIRPIPPKGEPARPPLGKPPEYDRHMRASVLKGESTRSQRWITAKKGDTLSKLALDVYGRVDDNILTSLQKNNPSISNIHWIAIGQEIYFPPARPEERLR
jgi:general secretion pathway protein A